MRKNKKRILAVDDDKGSLQLIGGILKRYYDLSMALNGEMAIRVLQNPEIEIDLVILDVNMPKMDGLEVLEKMEELGIEKHVIMLTGESGSEPLRSSQESDRVIKYMKKPPSSSILIEEINNYFAKQQLKKGRAQQNKKKKEVKEKTAPVKIEDWQGVIGIVSKIKVGAELKVTAVTQKKEIQFSVEKEGVWLGVGVPSKGTAVVLANIIGDTANYARPYEPSKDKHLFGKELAKIKLKLEKK